MRIIVQRVNYAKCRVNNEITGEIKKGFLLLVGFQTTDSEEILPKMVKKVAQLRIFEDENMKLNLALKDVQGGILSISQFTLYGSVKNGNRPSFIDAMRPDDANKLYKKFNTLLSEATHLDIQTGIFQADMKLEFENDGPCTIIIDSDQL